MQPHAPGSDLLIIDFEACDIKDGSWPIEVGIGYRDDLGQWQTAAKLIRPEPHWREELWTAEAEAVHGISREELNAAPSAREGADWLLAHAEGRMVVSDFPRKDEPWCDMLLAAGTGESHLWVYDFCWDILQSRFSDEAFYAFYAGTGPFEHDRPRTHRAEADVRHHIETWTMMETFVPAA
jgi:hypothetical protein